MQSSFFISKLPNEIIAKVIIGRLIDEPNSLLELKLVSKKFNRLVNSSFVNQSIRMQIHLECPSIFTNAWLETDFPFEIDSNLELLKLVRELKSLLENELIKPDSEVHEWIELIKNTIDKNKLWKNLYEMWTRKCLYDRCVDSVALEYALDLHCRFYRKDRMNYPPPLEIFVYLLLSSGADLEAPVSSDRGITTPLFFTTTSMKNLNASKLLIFAGANIHCRRSSDEFPLFFKLCSFQNREIAFYERKDLMKLLQKAGINIEESASLGIDEDTGRDISITPLQYAVSSSSYQGVKVLIDLGVDIHKLDSNGCSYLHSAIVFGRKESAHFLIKAGADINAYNENGLTLLSFMLLFSDCIYGPPKVKLIIELGADVNKANLDGTTPLQLAIDKGIKSYIKLLTQAGAEFANFSSGFLNT